MLELGPVSPRRVLSLLLLALVMVCVPSSPAFGQEDGVTVDPDSPSGKEYALPLEDARRRAGSRGKGKRRSGQSPLFGAGVGASGAGRTSGSRSRDTEEPAGGSSRGRRNSREKPGSAGASARSPDTERIISRSGTVPSGGMTPLSYVGAALLLLGVGVGVGVVLKRRSV